MPRKLTPVDRLSGQGVLLYRLNMKIYIRQDYAKKIDPCHMFVWLGRITVQNMVKNRATIGSGQYTLLSGRLSGRSCSNSNLLRPRVIFVRSQNQRSYEITNSYQSCRRSFNFTSVSFTSSLLSIFLKKLDIFQSYFHLFQFVYLIKTFLSSR